MNYRKSFGETLQWCSEHLVLPVVRSTVEAELVSTGRVVSTLSWGA